MPVIPERHPHDRMPLAQAQIEDVPVPTADPAMGRDNDETVW